MFVGAEHVTTFMLVKIQPQVHDGHTRYYITEFIFDTIGCILAISSNSAMGVISVGASLGVRASRKPHDAQTPALDTSSTTSTPSVRRSLSSTVTSSAASISCKKLLRKRGTAHSAKKRNTCSVSSSENEHVAAVVTSVAQQSPDPSTCETTSHTNVTASVSPVDTKKSVKRLVHVKTTVDPQRLAPHLIGIENSKLDTIMSRARCRISYHKLMVQEPRNDGMFTMAFIISADTVQRVRDGAQLLYGVVESTEQQLKEEFEVSEQGKRNSQVQEVTEATTEEVLSHEKRVQSLTNSQSLKRQTALGTAAFQQISSEHIQSCSRSRSSSRREGSSRRPIHRREADDVIESASKRGESEELRPANEEHLLQFNDCKDQDETYRGNRKAVDRDAVTKAKEERHMHDEREAFRIRLARTARIQRRLEAETKRARAQEVLERNKYLQLRRKFEEMRHRKKVAELVLQKQCNAMSASVATSSPSKKKQRLREIERLSIAHDACPPAKGRILAPMLHINASKTRRLKSNGPSLAGSPLFACNFAADDDLVRLREKVRAFGKMVTSGLSAEVVLSDEHNATHDVNDSDASVFPNEETDVSMGATDNDGPADAADSLMTDENTDEACPRRESFRSTWDLPGLTRDLNLIQDYSLESDCKLLRFLAGERQYFYLEPLASGDTYSCDLERWLLTPHDLQILQRYILERAEIGHELVLYAERVRALGNLTPSFSHLSSTDPIFEELNVFESSRHKVWSELQNKIVTLHSFALVAHMMGKHYVARQALESNRAAHPSVCHENLLDKGTLESDIFTYILRPIRSSAIESSLFDSLPISLVRETIEQCPEVVNHVLQWKSKDDVPEYLRIVDPFELQTSEATCAAAKQRINPSNTYFLRNLLVGLTAIMRNMDVAIKELVAALKQKQSDSHMENAQHVGFCRQRIIEHVNQLKSATTHVIVKTTKLQLHKWWLLFADNSCVWFDPDDVDETDDRSYDKFTCLQDALYVWHNKALLYTTKDDFVDPDRLEESSLDQFEEFDLIRTEGDDATDNAHPLMQREEDLAATIRITPASMRNDVLNRPFTREETNKCVMTPVKVEEARCQLEESLAITRDVMSELGRAGPWRAHIKHLNTLKGEQAKQVAIQKKLVQHQWARYYLKYQDFAPSQSQNEILDSERSLARIHTQGAISTHGDDTTSIINDGLLENDPADSPEVHEIKKLRREITLAKDQLLHDIREGGNYKAGASLSLNPDQKKLIEECEGLAASCIQALGKLLGIEKSEATCETPLQKTVPKQSRAKTRSAQDNRHTVTVSKGETASRMTMSSGRRYMHRSKKADAKSGSERRSRRVESIRIAKALAASSLGLSLPATRSSGSKMSSSRATSVRSIKATRGQRSHDNSPLRMGCTGCRDVRRRCTGCSGCCLHCVCVRCGCRMCCSSQLATIQKIMTHMLDHVEAKEACKWMSNASTGQHCGMLFFCLQCHCCEGHCSCILTNTASHSALHAAASAESDSSSNVVPSRNAIKRGRASAPPSRNKRRFKINFEAGQRRGPNLSSNNEDEVMAVSSVTCARSMSKSGLPQMPHARQERTPLPTFDYDIESAYGLGLMDQRGQCRTWQPAPSDKNEQEDLFRAARVRMKLVRSTFAKPLGQSLSPGCLDGEQLWQPERIQMMWERRDFHGVLGLPRDATTQQIKRQYRKLALKLHPDKTSDASASLESTFAEAEKNVEARSFGKRVDAFVAATHSYKILLGDVKVINGLN